MFKLSVLTVQDIVLIKWINISSSMHDTLEDHLSLYRLPNYPNAGLCSMFNEVYIILQRSQ